jgi:2-methylaconitate cis-trans-isomerase PrpF
MCLGVACRIAGTIPNLLATPPKADEIRVGNPSGIVSVGAEVRQDGGTWVAESAVVFRTARILMKGAVAAGAA